MSWADLLDETIAVLQDNNSKSQSESPDDDLKTNNNILYVEKKIILSISCVFLTKFGSRTMNHLDSDSFLGLYCSSKCFLSKKKQ